MEIETEINKVMEAISSFKINMCLMEKFEGCIICYSYPGKEDWNKKNTLTTNFCEECNVVLCSDCYKKIDEYKCPICHKQSHLIRKRQVRQEVRQVIRNLDVIQSLPVESVSIQQRMRLAIERINNNANGIGFDISPVREVERDRSGAEERIRWNNVDITSYQRTPQENRRLRNQRYRQRKRARINEERETSVVEVSSASEE